METLTNFGIGFRAANCIEQIKKYRQKEEVNSFPIEDFNEPLEKFLKYKGNNSAMAYFNEIESDITVNDYHEIVFADLPSSLQGDGFVIPQIQNIKKQEERWEKLEKTVLTFKKMINKEDVSSEELDNAYNLMETLNRNTLSKEHSHNKKPDFSKFSPSLGTHNYVKPDYNSLL